MKNKVIQRIVNENNTLMLEIRQENHVKNVYLIETNEDFEYERTIFLGRTTLSKADTINFISNMDIIQSLYNKDYDKMITILKSRGLIYDKNKKFNSDEFFYQFYNFWVNKEELK